MREILRTGQDAKPDSAIGQIVEAAQDEKHEWGTAAYTLATIAERQVKFAVIATVGYMYVRNNDILYRVALTIV